MTSKFTITIKDNVDSFLGMQISRNRDNKTISLSQPGYIESILSKFNTNPCPNDKLPTTPMMQSDLIDDLPTHLTPSQQTLYMKIVGSLLFLATRTRPDISFVVNYLTLYMTKATQHHLNICYRVLNYLSKTKTLPLIFNGTGGHNFSVMVDASYASHHDRKSHYGLSVHMNSNSGSCIAISKKGSLLALSSTEAEYIGLFEASKIIMWFRQILTELGFPQTSPTTLYEDNKSAIHIVNNGNDKGRTKHMDIRYHLVRDLVKNHHISVCYKPTEDMIADILTKPLDVKHFKYLRKFLLGSLD